MPILLGRGGLVGEYGGGQRLCVGRPLDDLFLNAGKLLLPELVRGECLLSAILPGAEADNFGVVGDRGEHHDGGSHRNQKAAP